jgi:prepilin-type N-terminal cleavage/methylation domain-containing protein
MREARADAHRRSGGFTLIELIIVICLVAVFMAVALDRLRRYQESAEKSMVELTVASMQSGLQCGWRRS